MVTSIGIGIANAIGFNRAKKGGSSTSPKPIASYRCYDKTNDDTDRDVLKDLTGNGHDIQLYNFAFSRESGYGLYYITQKGNYKITNVKGTDNILLKLGVPENTIVTLEIKGLPDGALLECRASLGTHFIADKDGIYSTPPFKGAIGVAITGFTGDCEIDIIEYPQYKGALVSDGVDDYGLCENFPILTKEKGFTICAIRTYIDKKVNGCLLSKSDKTNSQGEFVFEYQQNEYGMCLSYGNSVKINNFTGLFSYLSSSNFCGISFTKGNNNSDFGNELSLFCIRKVSYHGIECALYALEIYDRDLTDEEIAKVKERMIAEYEEKTGNKYEEETV